LLVLRTAGVDVSKPWRLEQLDGAAVARYEAAALARRRTPLEVDRGRSTAFSTLNQARMVVSHRAQRSAQYAGLRLPASVEEFLTRTVERGRPAEKPAIGVETMRRFERGRALMRRFAPRHWLALLLARELGLRAGEVVHARWDWVREVASQVNAARRWWQCAIVITDAFGPKGRPRRFDLDAGQVAAWQEALTLRGTLSPAAEVLPGTLADRERVLDELREWLRAIGIARDPKVKPLHLLRALRATELAETRGIDAAQAHLGHESARTTRAHYLLPAQP
jgi:integrase